MNSVIEPKHVMDIVEERTQLFALEPNLEKRQDIIKAAVRAASADMYRESPWFARQMKLTGTSKKHYRKYAGLKEFGPAALQEVLFALSMLFIDSGLSDDQLTAMMEK